MVAPSPRKVKSRRKPPSPNSVLDRSALIQALDDHGISYKPSHIEGLYQALHRANYPDLPDFVSHYLENERLLSERDSSSPPLAPLKNAVTNRKNRNRFNLPNRLLRFLQDPKNGLVTLTSTIQQAKTSSDGTTTKVAVRLHDGQLVESVIMRYTSVGGSRASLCVSSQCGCAMGCTFCATGTMGLSGNLTAGEILEQVVHADHLLADEWNQKDEESRRKKHELVRNVVFMGMGEPLDNYRNVVEACKALIDCKRWNLAHDRVTVSTVGLVSQIRKLTNELPEVSLALSLHAPTQEAREKIVPTARRYPIEELIDAVDGHMMAYLEKRRERLRQRPNYTATERMKESSKRRAMIEYVMLEGETSTLEAAHQLGRLCADRHLVVNLIPYNSTDVKDKLRCPSWDRMQEFRDIVASYKTFVTIRRTMGADIASACGQLITQEKEAAEEKTAVVVRDIEETGTSPKEPDSVEDEVVQRDSSKVETCQPDLERWIPPLAAATGLAATCFLVSTTLFLRRRGAK